MKLTVSMSVIETVSIIRILFWLCFKNTWIDNHLHRITTLQRITNVCKIHTGGPSRPGGPFSPRWPCTARKECYWVYAPHIKKIYYMPEVQTFQWMLLGSRSFIYSTVGHFVQHGSNLLSLWKKSYGVTIQIKVPE